MMIVEGRRLGYPSRAYMKNGAGCMKIGSADREHAYVIYVTRAQI